MPPVAFRYPLALVLQCFQVCRRVIALALCSVPTSRDLPRQYARLACIRCQPGYDLSLLWTYACWVILHHEVEDIPNYKVEKPIERNLWMACQNVSRGQSSATKYFCLHILMILRRHFQALKPAKGSFWACPAPLFLGG